MNLFSIRMRLGLFNGEPGKPEQHGKNNVDPTQAIICSQNHLDLVHKSARSSIILLKNNLGCLPVPKAQTQSSAAVIGPNANTSETLLGNYEGPPCRNVMILQALKKYHSGSTTYHRGCDFTNCTSDWVDEAVGVARGADHVVLVMGLDQMLEREKHDSVELGLPGYQENLVRSVAEVAKRPIVLVVLCGGPVDVSFAKVNPKIGSILWAGYSGEVRGITLAEILFGDHNPGEALISCYDEIVAFNNQQLLQ